jgi:hypothetical protein
MDDKLHQRRLEHAVLEGKPLGGAVPELGGAGQLRSREAEHLFRGINPRCLHGVVQGEQLERRPRPATDVEDALPGELALLREQLLDGCQVPWRPQLVVAGGDPVEVLRLAHPRKLVLRREASVSSSA